MARTQEHSNAGNMKEALRMGYVDAILISSSFARQLQNSGAYEDFRYIDVPEYVYINKAAHIFHTEEMRNKYNSWFAGISADGTFDEILDRWLGGELPAFEDIPKFELTGENGTLRVCDTGNYPPLSYYENDVLVGFDIEMAQRFAQYLGMNLEVSIVDYDEIEGYIAAGRFDMSAATKAITDEREQTILFGEPSLITEAVLIAMK
jgi:polar amino acid transport system substrate-binding protein